MAVAIGLAATAHSNATVLAYEGFDYAAGNLNTQSGGSGFNGAWAAANSTGGAYASPNGFQVVSSGATLWNGVAASVPQTGNYAGSPVATVIGGSPNGNDPDNLWAERTLDPSVTSTFTTGNTTWLSYVSASNFANNNNYTGGMLALGQGAIQGRGNAISGGPAVGIGIFTSTGVFRSGSVTPPSGPVYFGATIWDSAVYTGAGIPLNHVTSSQGFNPYYNATSSPTGLPHQAYVSIARIDWGATSTISVATFLDGVTITEAAFNANAVSQTFSYDPSTFNRVSFAGARYNIDELRITTTFNEVIGVPEPSAAWLSLLGLGVALRRRRN